MVALCDDDFGADFGAWRSAGIECFGSYVRALARRGLGSRMMGVGKAVAHSNIALAKYWGKADTVRNLTAVPSLSLTLAALRTVTTVRFDESLGADELSLGGAIVTGRPLQPCQQVAGQRARASRRDDARARRVRQ